MLRESSRLEGSQVNLTVVMSGETLQNGVPAENELVSFAEAAIGFDNEAIRESRTNLVAAIGEQGMIDAACIIANFQRMVRIADGTGIPLDTPVALVTAGLREDLGINNFGSADNTPPVVGLKRLFGDLMSKLLPFIFRRMAKK